MSDTVNAIMDAAERRIREAGYGGFSFRDIATDVGVKSASVHYHFPTKDALVASVARRYNDRIAAAVDDLVAKGTSIADAWRQVFREALRDGARMCLCGSLGATSGELAPEVAQEVRRFFDIGVESLMQGGSTKDQAMRVLATLEGAILMAAVQGEASIFDSVVKEI